jgi:hypothetical protein
MLAAVAFVGVTPGFVQAQSTSMTISRIGAGPHGFDWFAGAWTCTSTTASATGVPSTISFTAGASASGGVAIHSTAKAYEFYSYLSYAPKTKTWWSPSAYGNGDSSNVSSNQSGKSMTWTGTYFEAASGTTVTIRDTYTTASMTKYSDVNQAKIDGVWKTQSTTTCTKTL